MSEVRPATTADLPRCRAIQGAALGEPWPGLLSTALGTGATVLVVATGTGPVGYAVAFAVPGAPVYVPEFAVAPDHQSGGHGTRLLSGLLDDLARGGHERVRLTVRADDDRAREFYLARGFSVLERRPDHFDGGDGLLLERRLDSTTG